MYLSQSSLRASKNKGQCRSGNYPELNSDAVSAGCSSRHIPTEKRKSLTSKGEENHLQLYHPMMTRHCWEHIVLVLLNPFLKHCHDQVVLIIYDSQSKLLLLKYHPGLKVGNCLKVSLHPEV